MDPALLLRSYFLTAASAVLLVHLLPGFGEKFITYGPRAERTPRNAPVAPSEHSRKIPILGSHLRRLSDYAVTYRVPHAWFTHFYVVSVCCALFWPIQVVTNGSIFNKLASLAGSQERACMTVEQVIVTWMLMFAQGVRRLYESLTLTKPSQSKMWIVHWLVGISFYLCMSVAVWVEGTPALLKAKPLYHHMISAPSLRTCVSIPIFLIASGIQYDCHAYLASLEKYTLPTHPLFHNLICPHYFAECVIYLALALIAAPTGDVLNKTMLCALVFVAINLGVTADTSKQWYAQKFGREKVEGRWRMIPFLY